MTISCLESEHGDSPLDQYSALSRLPLSVSQSQDIAREEPHSVYAACNTLPRSTVGSTSKYRGTITRFIAKK
ncbi:hypothetical protein KIN20_018416 [Parelaphostrongylus tenuis]|uniref:Uncharacterized protein n=1 Tax=Parelaphostrongylus tenuis TaxID=148309 RepID=A0AAD5N3N7_PARTN|nr:hypothetical protein KIN20_018416 [Parelaphostrongylus tenuis]